MQLWHALVVERHLSADKDIQDDAKAPNVDFGSGILPCLEKLGCGKVQTTTEGLGDDCEVRIGCLSRNR